MPDQGFDDVRASYDRVAAGYVRELFHELDQKPLDRQLLDQFTVRLTGHGPVCDLGCGPGHVTAYLRGRGLDVFGLDLSVGMVEEARRLSPEIEFRQGDLRVLDVPDSAWSGIVAFYSLLHVARGKLTAALRELWRVLRPGGLLLLAFHVGDGHIHRDELFGQPVALDFLFFRPAEMAGYLQQAGFTIEETIERDPYPDVEYPSRRCYLLAIRPDPE